MFCCVHNDSYHTKRGTPFLSPFREGRGRKLRTTHTGHGITRRALVHPGLPWTASQGSIGPEYPKMKGLIRESCGPSQRRQATGSSQAASVSRALPLSCLRKRTSRADWSLQATQESELPMKMRTTADNPRTGNNHANLFLPSRMIAIRRSWFQAERRISEIHGNPG